MKYELLSMPYKYDALEPFIDAKTMEIHHSKHHQGYVNKLNELVADHDDLKKKSPAQILENLEVVPDSIKDGLIFFAGGVVNHDMFWSILKKDVKIKGEVQKAINTKYKGFDSFKEAFMKLAMDLKGSGWTWLVVQGAELKMVNTSNQDCPLMKGMKPVLMLDMWEHAYYLKYQNRKAEYIGAFFNIINWDTVNNLYVEAMKNGYHKD